MKIFISDLHLGDGSRTDDFHRDKEFLEFLEFAEAEAQELIIVGDLLELWQADLDRVLFKHSELIKRLLLLRNKIKLTYVVGNHDYIPFERFTDLAVGICLEYRDEGGIVAEHGHRYDIFNRYKNPLQSIRWPSGKRLNLFVASLEKFLHPGVDKWTKKALENFQFLRQAMSIRNKITPATKAYLKRGGHFGEFEKAVKNHLNKGAKIVIFGHTHRAQLYVIENGIYANCGAWIDGITPTYIAYDRNKIELREALTHKTIKRLVLKEDNSAITR